ncbi:DoxX family protein [Pendulispora rubella]|uniref:DoxX family protein n=1 Tax=Pendulispora rubella TaxID=2741070 RepID=A0ABZ2KU46_9BACT
MDSASDVLAAAKPWFKILLAVGMVGIGILHFARPKPFIRIVPTWLPNPRALVLVSGFFEIAGGVGLLLPFTQRLAAWGLIVLYVAVFPANVHMAVHRISLDPKRPIPPYLLWLRLPFQLLFIAWAWWFV